ncbi:MAG: AarF/UbiB family protein [Patescibacteria group bacterium]
MSALAFKKIRSTFSDIKRFRTVATVMFEEGFAFALDEMQLRGLVPFRSRFLFGLKRGARTGGRIVGIKNREIPTEVRLRRALERLGPTFMKLGQLLSTRSDILPDEYIQELAKLQDCGPTMGPGVAEKIIEDQLNTSLENVFASFEVEPVAAASLAQVHRATLRDGRRVAVKVRRMGIEQIIRTDIHILAYLAQLLEKHIEASRKFRPVRIVREFADWTLREIDFEIEGAHTDLFRESFSDVPDVVIPRVYWDYCGPAVLVTDLLEGVKVDDLTELDRQGIDRHSLASIGLKAGMRMFLVDGFFHADPHPGNLVVLPPERDDAGQEIEPLRLGMYDFGMVGRISEQHRLSLIGCFISFVEQDIDSYIKHILSLADKEESSDVRSFESQVRTILTGVIHKPTEKKGLARAFYLVLVAGAEFGVMFPADLILLAKAFVTVERNGFKLWPDINLEQELKPYLVEVMRAELNPTRLAKELKSAVFDNLYFVRHLPEQTQALLKRLDRGEIDVRLNLQELRDLKEEFDRQNDVRVLAILAVAVLLASAAVLRLDDQAMAYGIPLGRIGFAVSLVIVVWLFMLIRKRP